MKHFVLAYLIAITASQHSEDDCRQNRQGTQNKKRQVSAVNHFRRIGSKPIGNKERRGEPGGGDTEADRKLLHSAGYGTGVARVLVADVGVDQSIHARILQRRESAVAEG